MKMNFKTVARACREAVEAEGERKPIAQAQFETYLKAYVDQRARQLVAEGIEQALGKGF